jgi:hypothetical protein
MIIQVYTQHFFGKAIVVTPLPQSALNAVANNCPRYT